MWYRLYGLLVFVAGCWGWWYASPPMGKQPGMLLILYVGGFAAICMGIAFVIGGGTIYRWLKNRNDLETKV